MLGLNCDRISLILIYNRIYIRPLSVFCFPIYSHPNEGGKQSQSIKYNYLLAKREREGGRKGEDDVVVVVFSGKRVHFFELSLTLTTFEG